MGGILAAEVALLGSDPRQAFGSAFRHRIVGTICFDTPFLGMHPGVITSGMYVQFGFISFLDWVLSVSSLSDYPSA